jgi:hypothetical protein
MFRHEFMIAHRRALRGAIRGAGLASAGIAPQPAGED